MGREQARNTFAKGMNQDTAYSIYNGEQYFSAFNVRPTTDDMGLSTGSLASVKGNSLDFTIPDVGDSWKLKALDTFVATNFDNTARFLDLTIGGINRQIPYQVTEPKVFYEVIADFINSGGYGASIPIVAQFSIGEIVIYTTDYSFLAPVFSTHLDFSTTLESPGATDLVVIGSVDLRESIIMCTAPSTANGSGQIWEVTWDINSVPTLRLVRNSGDNFAKEFPIEMKSRQETSTIRRVYWTDNENSVRTINIDSDTAYIDNIDILPSALMDIPIPIELHQAGGGLDVALYSVSYRLKSLGGAETSFSPFSPTFRITAGNEVTSAFVDYQGSPQHTATTKAITYRIDNIDSNFSFIDILVAEYDTAAPIYYLVKEGESLLGSSSYEFTIDTVTSEQIIDEAEILLPPASFAAAKTIDIKDNRLMVANIRDLDLSLSDWDSHAYRYNGSMGTDGYEATTNKINKFNKDSTRTSISTDQQKFQSDGVTLGASGANVNYKFITQDLQLDNLGGTGDIQNVLNTEIRYDVDKLQSDITLNSKILPMGGLWKNYSNPFFESWFKGYHRSEVYRFGIVFFDRKGRASAVKWISDIRMPDPSEVNTFTQTSSELLGHALGVEFDVTITADMKSTFTGFSIVRAHRGSADYTILAQGLIGDTTNELAYSDGTGGFPDVDENNPF